MANVVHSGTEGRYEDTSTRRIFGGLYTDRDRAEAGINRLRTVYGSDQIGIVMRDTEQAEELAERTDTKDHASSAGKGALAGGGVGGVLGGITGLLVGLGTITIPGVGPVVAGGALAAALGITGGTAAAGAGLGAAAGGLVGALVGLGFPEDEAEYYERGIREGQILVTVQNGDARAAEILDETGAQRYSGSTATTTTRTHRAA